MCFIRLIHTFIYVYNALLYIYCVYIHIKYAYAYKVPLSGPQTHHVDYIMRSVTLHITSYTYIHF